MPDKYISKRVTSTQQNKGTISTQSYLSNTTRTVSTIPPGSVETSQRTQPEEVATTKVFGGRTEVQSSSGVGGTKTTVEDKGVILKFTIPLQNRQPITRT